MPDRRFSARLTGLVATPAGLRAVDHPPDHPYPGPATGYAAPVAAASPPPPAPTPKRRAPPASVARRRTAQQQSQIAAWRKLAERGRR